MKKILVVEDEPSVRENILELLDVEGFEVFGAGDGLAGVELAQQHLPNLILCDVMMPKLDGFGVLSALRENPLTEMIPLIFLTAKADKSDLRQAMELGVDDYITKPFTVEELLKAISARLEKTAVLEQKSQQKLDQLVNSISLSLHQELRSPLNSILGFSQLLIEEFDSLERQEIKKMSEEINQHAENLSSMIQKFLLYSDLELMATDSKRIEALQGGRSSSISSMVKEIIIHLAKRFEREADLQLELQDSSIAIAKVKLEKIVEELLNNAFKHSQAGTTVRVVGTPLQDHTYLPGNLNNGKGFTESAKHFYALSVTNQGMLTKAVQLAEVGTHHKCKHQLMRNQQALGLGLNITTQLAQLLGGELTIESTPDQQTTVRVLLPI